MPKFRITTKILLALLGLSLFSLALFGYVSFVRMKDMADFALDRSVLLGKAAVDDSKGALIRQAESGIIKIAQDQAAISNAFLEKVEDEVNLMADFASRIWAEGGFVKGRHSYYIDEKPKDILDASCYFVPKGVNRDYLRKEIDLSNSMDEVFAPIYANDSNLDSVYLGTVRGLFRNYPWSSDFDPSYDHRKRLWYKEAIKNKKAVWSKPYINVGTNELIVTYSKPFYSAKNKLIGVVAADVTLKALNSYILNTQIGKRGYSFLIDNKGNIIVYPGIKAGKTKWNQKYLTKNLLNSNSPGLKNIVKDMIAGHVGVRRFKGDPIIKGDDKYVAYAPLTSTKWSLGVVMPVREIIAPAFVTESKISSATKETGQHINRLIKKTFSTLGVIFVIVIAGVLFVSHIVSRKITRPILTLSEGAKIIGSGNLEHKFNINTGDEIEGLANSFNKMTTDLKNYISDLKDVTAQKERIESELKIAHQIQESMLPKIFPPFPERKEFDIFAKMTPAKEVGGDLYDFFLIGEDKLCLLIGDVSGKGVPAALFMAISKALLKTKALQGLSPDKILSEVNELLVPENESCMFVTVFCVVLDIKTGNVEFSNGGHNPPLVSKAGGDFEYLSIPKGFVVGAMENMNFKKGILKLDAGDSIFLYTDGVTEAMNEKGELFSEGRLKDSLSKLKNSDASAIINGVMSDISSFVKGAPQSDDITMMALRYKGDKDHGIT